MDRLEFARALAQMQEAERVAHSVPDPLFEMMSRCQEAENLRYLGDVARTLEIAGECQTFAQQHLGETADSLPICVLAKALNDVGRHEEAHVQIHGLLERSVQQHGAASGLYFGIFDILACIASRVDQHNTAAQLFGAADGDAKRARQRRSRNSAWAIEAYIQRSNEALGDDVYMSLHRTGEAMMLVDAIDYARKFQIRA